MESVGIITTLYTSVTERTKEIGTMKAIGAKSRFILTLFLTEALFIGILGSTFGILSGIGGAYVLTSGFAPSSPGQGGGGGAAASHIDPVFVPTDLFNVWILSTILESDGRSISSMESIQVVAFGGTPEITELQIITAFRVVM